MTEHHATVTVKAPVHQVYTLFTHFHDFPKFMSFVKEVTYYDDRRSHWVVDVAGTQEWDAVNEAWVPDQQVGWRSTSGLENSGMVRFTALGPERTQVDVYITYKPPAGALGEAIAQLNYGQFDQVLQQDLNNFARMVEQAPAGALDPMRSHYLFHDESAVLQGKATQQQQEAMKRDPRMAPEALDERTRTIERENEQQRQTLEEQWRERERLNEEEQQALRQQQAELQRQAELDREAAEEAARAVEPAQPREPHPVYDTLGGRNASMDRTALGDREARSERFPGQLEDPMTARAPGMPQSQENPSAAESEHESPWRVSMLGRNSEEKPADKETEREQQRQSLEDQQ